MSHRTLSSIVFIETRNIEFVQCGATTNIFILKDKLCIQSGKLIEHLKTDFNALVKRLLIEL